MNETTPSATGIYNYPIPYTDAQTVIQSIGACLTNFLFLSNTRLNYDVNTDNLTASTINVAINNYNNPSIIPYFGFKILILLKDNNNNNPYAEVVRASQESIPSGITAVTLTGSSTLFSLNANNNGYYISYYLESIKYRDGYTA